MSLIAKDKGGQDFAPIPAGMHHAICYGVCDLGTQPAFGNFPAKRKVVFIWELPDERGIFQREGRDVSLPRAISARFTLSLSKKSNLRPMLEGWRGRAFTEAELDGFDVMNVCGANALLNVIHEQKNGKTYANVKTVTPLPKGMAKKTAENPPLKFSLEDFGAGIPVVFPENMPDWIKALVMQSEEYIRKQQNHGQPEPTEEEMTNLSPDASDENVPF